MPRKGQFTKSEFLIWQQLVEGQRWALRVYCKRCLELGEGETDEQPYVPNMDDLHWYCTDQSLLDVQELYNQPLNSIALLDGVDNVPEQEMGQVEREFLDSVDCPMPGHDVKEARWVRL